jgi:hypothetical protein
MQHGEATETIWSRIIGSSSYPHLPVSFDIRAVIKIELYSTVLKAETSFIF